MQFICIWAIQIQKKKHTRESYKGQIDQDILILALYIP